MLLRTWDDFCCSAACLFGKDEAKKLPALMKEHNITQLQILCFINWTAGMIQQEIADELNITQQAISKHISFIHRKWPYILKSARPERMEQYRSEQHDHRVRHQF